MIQLLNFTIILLSCVVGVYSIVVNYQLRVKYKTAFVHSLFYYQLLYFVFGVYGILGSLLIRIVLPQIDVSLLGTQLISNIIPFIGIPFLIAAWFMLQKASLELIQEKKYRYLSIFYFLFVLSGFLAYGLVIRNMSNVEPDMQEYTQQKIFFGYGVIDFVVMLFVAFTLIFGSKKNNRKIKRERMLYMHLTIMLLSLSLMRSFGLYYSSHNLFVGLYFIMVFFVGNLPLILLCKMYLANKYKKKVTNINLEEEWVTVFAISPREHQIVDEIFSGKTNQQIADTLFISLQTVKDHCSNIYRKVGVKSRVQLIQKVSNY